MSRVEQHPLGARTPPSAVWANADDGVRAPRYGQARRPRAFTLVEVLAALLMMAIVIPVAMEGMSIASRAGVMGTRKAAAMRVAERLLNELVIGNQLQQSASSGTIEDGDTTYPWTMRTEAWSEDAMLQMTVTVNFVVRGNTYDVSVSTLLPTATTGTELAATQQ